MKKNIVASIFLLGLTACSTMQHGGLVDENILLKVPIPGSGWANQSGEKGDESIMMWQKKDEWFKITISHDRFRPEPGRFKSGMDEAAKQNFTTDFQSKELKEGLVNNYPMILWQTEAILKSGAKTLNLFLYIKGNDATYLVNRRWIHMQVPDAEKQLWIDYMSTVSVCDNRYPEHQSPKMEQAWPGLYYPSKSTNGVSQ
jgi:hypothetical protein